MQQGRFAAAIRVGVSKSWNFAAPTLFPARNDLSPRAKNTHAREPSYAEKNFRSLRYENAP